MCPLAYVLTQMVDRDDTSNTQHRMEYALHMYCYSMLFLFFAKINGSKKCQNNVGGRRKYRLAQIKTLFP